MNKLLYNKFLYIVLALFVLISCTNKVSIRTIKEVKKTYNAKKITSIDFLLEATVFENRDIVASSIYYLGEVLEDLQTRPKKWKLKSNDVVRSNQDRIVNRLLKVYAVNDDFNIKLLVIEALSKVESQSVYTFYLNCLEEVDASIVKSSLINLRPYAQKDIYDLASSLDKVITCVADDKKILVLVAIDTLFFFAPQQSVLETLQKSKVKWDDAFMNKMFEEKIEIYRIYLSRATL